MGTNQVRFRVEHNKAKTNFWYTLVAGNGNTVMTSKSTYDDYENARRAARRQIEALSSAPLALEHERDGETVIEQLIAERADGGAERSRVVRQTKWEPVAMPNPSHLPAEALLNPNS